MTKKYDVIIIGAGAAGLSAASVALGAGKRVLILEMGNAPARKVAISGGGRCNITNADANVDRYFGKNPDFVRGALSRYTPADVLQWCKKHNLNLEEKTTGRFFCTNGADAVVQALIQDSQGADVHYDTQITDIEKVDNMFVINDFCAPSVIVATGGVSWGAVGVSDAGYKIAKKFGHKIVPVRPALCALKISGANADLAGITMDAEITVGKRTLRDSLLLTHFGIGGPLAYRASLNDLNNGFYLNLLPDVNVADFLKTQKNQCGGKSLVSILSDILPKRIAKKVIGENTKNIADVSNTEIEQIAQKLTKIFIPGDKISLHGLSAAEVVRGGIDTADVSSKTMESKLCSGLFFAGEVLDIAGDLGGFNLHWAWASGYVAGMNA